MKIITGDLLKMANEGEFDVICHGANCFGTFGSGIAKSIKDMWPEVYAVDCNTVRGDYNKLGTFSACKVNDGAHTVVNAYTQYGFNYGGKTDDVFEYLSFGMILVKLAHFYPSARFGFPLIGQGLACGNATVINNMLTDFDQLITKSGGTVTIVQFG